MKTPVYCTIEGDLLEEEEYEPEQDIRISDYVDTLVKGIYENNPKITYPMITINEIRNTENTKFSTSTGEKVSNLAYQFDCYSKDLENLQAAQSAKLMGKILNKLIGGPRYKMNRIGTPVLLPLTQDKTVLKYSLRYSCVLDLERHIIFKS